jgi:peptidoglycan/LPS O-acetylase OafA/YrhL
VSSSSAPPAGPTLSPAPVLDGDRNQLLFKRLNQKTIPSLDGIRALAAMCVVGLHGAYDFIPGRLGVLVFFVLSGFLITRLLLIEENKTGTICLKRFYERRSFRIFPAFYAYCVAVTIYLLPNPPWAKLATCYFYVSNYALVWMRPDFPMPGAWSLSIEEQFYLLWPASFRHLVRRGKDLLKILAGIVIAVQMWKLVLFFAHADSEYLHSASDTRCSDLLIGCILAILTHRGFRLPGFLLRPAATLIPASVLLVTAYFDAVGRHEIAIAFFYTPAALATALLMLQCIALCDRQPFR